MATQFDFAKYLRSQGISFSSSPAINNNNGGVAVVAGRPATKQSSSHPPQQQQQHQTNVSTQEIRSHPPPPAAAASKSDPQSQSPATAGFGSSHDNNLINSATNSTNNSTAPPPKINLAAYAERKYFSGTVTSFQDLSTTKSPEKISDNSNDNGGSEMDVDKPLPLWPDHDNISPANKLIPNFPFSLLRGSGGDRARGGTSALDAAAAPAAKIAASSDTPMEDVTSSVADPIPELPISAKLRTSVAPTHPTPPVLARRASLPGQTVTIHAPPPPSSLANLPIQRRNSLGGDLPLLPRPHSMAIPIPSNHPNYHYQQQQHQQQHPPHPQHPSYQLQYHPPPPAPGTVPSYTSSTMGTYHPPSNGPPSYMNQHPYGPPSSYPASSYSGSSMANAAAATLASSSIPTPSASGASESSAISIFDYNAATTIGNIAGIHAPPNAHTYNDYNNINLSNHSNSMASSSSSSNHHNMNKMERERGGSGDDNNSYNPVITKTSKGFVCEHPNCGRIFSRKEHAQRHSRIHSGQKPFACPFAERTGCNKRFSRADNRDTHAQTHQ